MLFISISLYITYILSSHQLLAFFNPKPAITYNYIYYLYILYYTPLQSSITYTLSPLSISLSHITQNLSLSLFHTLLQIIHCLNLSLSLSTALQRSSIKDVQHNGQSIQVEVCWPRFVGSSYRREQKLIFHREISASRGSTILNSFSSLTVQLKTDGPRW